MGQKINPTGFRLSVSTNWTSRWYANGDDFRVHAQRGHPGARVPEEEALRSASVGRVMIERPAKNARITIFSARPGVVIGKKGEDIEALKARPAEAAWACRCTSTSRRSASRRLDAQLIADSITPQLEKRIMFRRAMKRAMQNAMRLGAQGIKIMSAGRLNGAEIARTEWYREGRVPLHTLRADIDYGFSEAKTTYGVIGVKVWVFKGECSAAATRRRPRRPRQRRRRSAMSASRPGDAPPARAARRGGAMRREPKQRRPKPLLPRRRPRTTPRGRPSSGCARWLPSRPTRSPTAARKNGDETCCSQHDGSTARSRRAATSGVATRGAKVAFGEFGLKATGRGRLTARQIEAARRAMTRHIKRGGRIWIRIFPDKPISQKPAEVRMGNGKG